LLISKAETLSEFRPFPIAFFGKNKVNLKRRPIKKDIQYKRNKMADSKKEA